MKISYEYGAVAKTDRPDRTMPEDIRLELAAQLDAIAAYVGGEEVTREFVWIPPSRSDPLSQHGTGIAKIVIEQEVDREAYLAVLAAEGWRPYRSVRGVGINLELRDVWIDGKVARYARPAQV